MKRSELFFNVAAVPTDAAMLLCAAVASFYLRLRPEIVAKIPLSFNLQLHDFLGLAIKVLPLLLIIFAFFGLYNLKGTRNFATEFGKIIASSSLGLLLVILVFFFNVNFFQDVFPSRFIILAAWGLGIVFVFLGRLVLRNIQEYMLKQGIGLHRLAVIKGEAKETFILENIFRNKKQGYQVVAELNYNPNILEQLEILYRQNKIDEILQANPLLDDETNFTLVEFSRSKGLSFSFVPNLFEAQRNQVEMYRLSGVPIIALKNTPLDGWGKVVKRLLDILFSSICLVITSPVFLFVAVAIKLDSQGKIIYAGMRGGRDKDFKFFKFRTMYQHLSVGEGYGGKEAEKVRKELWEKNDRGGKDGPFLKIKHDPRVTKVGRFLRKTKLDELPQFWNVLKGDMSMVGPRAHVLDEVGRYKDRYRRMFSIKPGIFGLSQISQLSFPDLPFEEEIRLNTYYIENWSVWLDIKILAKSFWLLFFGSKPREDY